jgi:hypothetical protein
MRHKWFLAVCAAVVLLTTACSSKGGISSAQGKVRANATRKSTATVYWKLYNAIGAPAFDSDGTGHFTTCGNNGSSSTSYYVRSILGVKSDKRVTPESLTQAVAGQLAGVGWHLSPASGLKRSAKKGGITVKLEPPEFIGSDSMTALQVQGGCVDVGAAEDSITDGSAQNSDKYNGDDASKSPVPTTFPSPIG